MSLNKIFPVDRQIVSSIELPNRDNRLDPSRYNERGEAMNRHLKQLGIDLPCLKELEAFKEVYLPNRFSRIYLDDEDSGLPMLGTSTMLMARLPTDTRIRVEGDPARSPLRIQSGDILISRSGTVGTTVLCGDSYSKHVASDDCFRVRVEKSISGFITAYLQSPFGKTLLVRDAHGKVIKHLKDHDIKNIRIPIIQKPTLSKINKLMIDSMKCIDIARNSFDEGEVELCNLLGVQSKDDNKSHWLNRKNKTFLKNSVALFNYRLDPHFFYPNINDLRSKFTTLPHKTLGKIAEVWGVGRFKRLRADEGHGTPLFSSGDIMRTILTPSTHISSERNSKNIKQCLIREGTILIPCSGALGGILGRCVRSGKKLHGQAVSQHSLRIQVTDPDFISDYVVAFLSSLTFGYPIITAFRYGKDVPELNPDDLKTIPIPKLPKPEQKKVAQYISIAYTNIDRANELEDEAQKELLEALQWNIETETWN